MTLLGRVLAKRYRLERPLGQGGMGAVWVAKDLNVGHDVAVKTLLEGDEGDVERLRREAFAAASLAHPNIVRCTDFVHATGDEPAFLVMELLRGSSLSGFLAQRGALPYATAIHITLQMLDALGAAHRAGILHRDIKPGNVVVLDGPDRERPSIKLVDFGLAKLMNDESRHTSTGTLLGTPAYMAPEQLLGDKATEATDVYAVGVCLYQMLAGSRPFVGSGGELTAAILKAEPPDLPVDESLASIVRRAMHRDPAMRFASAAMMTEALSKLSDPIAHTRPRPSAPKPRWMLFALTVLSTIAGLSGVVLIVTSRKSAPEKPPIPAPTSPPPSATIAPDPVPEEPDASELPERTDAEASDAAPVASAAVGPKKVLSFCVAEGYAVCAQPVWDCECWNQNYQIRPNENPSGSSRWRPGGPWRGQPCNGYVHFRDGKITPMSGTFTCGAACDDTHRRSSRRQAVPGTPCSGYQHEKLLQGIWYPVRE